MTPPPQRIAKSVYLLSEFLSSQSPVSFHGKDAGRVPKYRQKKEKTIYESV